MDKDFQESPVDKELLCSNTEATQEDQDADPPQDQELDRVFQDQQIQSPESFKQDREQLFLHSNLDQVDALDEDGTKENVVQDEVEVKDPAKLQPPEGQTEVQGLKHNPSEVHNGHEYGGVFAVEEKRESDPSPVDHQQSINHVDQDLLGTEQNQDQHLDRALPRDQNRPEHRLGPHSNSDQVQGRDPTTAAANRDEAGESGGSVPALVVTRAEEPGPAVAAPVGALASPAEPSEPRGLARPTDLAIPADLAIPVAGNMSSDPSLNSSGDGGDMACSDLLSLKSDSVSLASDPAASRRSEEDDTRSVTASSVTSLFHRVQLDPLEKDWLRSSALGNMAAQRQLLVQEPSLVLKKTALHWAAKQGRQEAVDMMLRFGADVNARSGYTALHLASIHGHQHIVRALVNAHNAKTSVRDYHGKTAVHYWSGCTDVFNKPESQSGGKFSRGRWTQRYALPSFRLSRSRSHGQLNLEFMAAPQSSFHDKLDLQV